MPNENSFYFLDDTFFDVVGDSNLMLNRKTDSMNLRPHYYSMLDSDGLLWMIPASSKVDLWKRRISTFKNKNRVIIVKTNAGSSVLLLQNMFPTLEKYIKCEYKNVRIIREADIEKVKKASRKIVPLLLRGFAFSKFPPDVKRIKQFMLDELENGLKG
jgi:hypothetical protein